MKQVTCRKKKTNKQTKKNNPKHNKEESVCFFAFYWRESISRRQHAVFFLSMVKLQISSPMSKDRHVSDNLIRTSPGGEEVESVKGTICLI